MRQCKTKGGGGSLTEQQKLRSLQLVHTPSNLFLLDYLEIPFATVRLGYYTSTAAAAGAVSFLSCLLFCSAPPSLPSLSVLLHSDL